MFDSYVCMYAAQSPRHTVLQPSTDIDSNVGYSVLVTGMHVSDLLLSARWHHPTQKRCNIDEELWANEGMRETDEEDPRTFDPVKSASHLVSFSMPTNQTVHLKPTIRLPHYQSSYRTPSLPTSTVELYPRQATPFYSQTCAANTPPHQSHQSLEIPSLIYALLPILMHCRRLEGWLITLIHGVRVVSTVDQGKRNIPLTYFYDPPASSSRRHAQQLIAPAADDLNSVRDASRRLLKFRRVVRVRLKV